MDHTNIHLAVAENSEIAITSEPEGRDNTVATTTVTEEDEDAGVTNNQESTDAEPKPASETGQWKTHAGTEPNREDDATTILVTYSSDACNLPEAGSDLSRAPLPAVQTSAGKTKPLGKRRHSRREAARRHAQHAIKRFLVFLVSHVGLTCLVVAYSIMGGFIFMALEGSNERASRTHIEGIRDYHVRVITLSAGCSC